jgi:activator of 2-hydroxyglutaryl-CoA dehydratase
MNWPPEPEDEALWRELGLDGGFDDFELNDRCSAGTGRFLEVMARALNYSLDEFCREAMQADRLETEGEILFVGGVAKSRCMAGLLRKKIKRDITVPPFPQILSALGAALSLGVRS